MLLYNKFNVLLVAHFFYYSQKKFVQQTRNKNAVISFNTELDEKLVVHFFGDAFLLEIGGNFVGT